MTDPKITQFDLFSSVIGAFLCEIMFWVISFSRNRNSHASCIFCKEAVGWLINKNCFLFIIASWGYQLKVVFGNRQAFFNFMGNQDCTSLPSMHSADVDDKFRQGPIGQKTIWLACPCMRNWHCLAKLHDNIQKQVIKWWSHCDLCS
jgi:hypothetical protein